MDTIGELNIKIYCYENTLLQPSNWKRIYWVWSSIVKFANSIKTGKTRKLGLKNPMISGRSDYNIGLLQVGVVQRL